MLWDAAALCAGAGNLKSRGLAMRVAMWVAVGMVSCVSAEMNVHVAAEAESGGDGARRRPYRTLEQARNGIRAARKAGALKAGEAVTVFLEPGVYPLEKSFELTAEDGGTAEAPVVY